MEKNNDRANLMVRRRALLVIGGGFAAASGILALQGCNKTGSGGSAGAGASAGGGAAAGGRCIDKIEVDETVQQLRKNLQYKEKSDTPGKKCSLCAQFEAERFTALGCGGCKLFGGAVNPEGVCLSFAPLNGAPAGAPAAAPANPAG